LRAATNAGVGGQLELSAVVSRLAVLRFANSAPTQAIQADEPIVRARVVLGARIGTARGVDLGKDAIVDLCRTAADIARVAPESPAFTGLPSAAVGEAPAHPVAVEQAELVAIDPEPHADLLLRLAAAADRAAATAAGVIEADTEHIAVASSLGIRRFCSRDAMRVELILSGPTRGGRGPSGHASFYGPSTTAVDAEALAERAADALARSTATVTVEPGPLDVVLGPVALAELCEWMALASFGARSMLDGSSLCAGRVGEVVSGPAVTLYDDGPDASDGAIPLPFDGEGTSKQRVLLLERGRCLGVVSDSITAAALGGAPSTGHAALATEDPSLFGGPMPQSLFFAAGDVAPHGNGDGNGEDALCQRVERGLYIPRFHYVNGLLDTRRALTTGMTRDGACLIEHGRKTRGIGNLRFTDSLLEAFARIDGATRARRACAPHLLSGPVVAPAVLIRGFRFTGQS
jgi:predicted Zn-dependent protease